MALWPAGQAGASTLVATHPGLMCTGAWALSVLTLHDGSSRAAGPQAMRDDPAVKQHGGCLDFAPGTRATLIIARFNTSVVSIDPHDGKGARTFTVPNIDFKLDTDTPAQAPDQAAEPPPATPAEDPLPGLDTARTFFANLARTCPQQGWTEHRLSHTQNGPVDAVYDSMTKAQQRAAQNEADLKCQDVPGLSCPADTVFGYMVRAGLMDRMVQAACAKAATR